MQFDIDLEIDYADLKAVLSSARAALANPDEILGSIGEALLRVNRQRHKQGVDPHGQAWKPLSPLTLAAGERKGGPLTRTGRMLASLNYQVDGDVLRLGFDGGDAFQAIWHQKGTDPYTIYPTHKKVLAFAGVVAKRVNHPGLPKRELLAFPESDQKLAADVAADHLTVILNRAKTAIK